MKEGVRGEKQKSTQPTTYLPQFSKREEAMLKKCEFDSFSPAPFPILLRLIKFCFKKYEGKKSKENGKKEHNRFKVGER